MSDADNESFVFPLSFAQERMWFIDQLQPGSALYNVPAAVRLRGAVDPRAMQAALDALVQRHTSLRTRFVVEEGQAMQVIEGHLSVVLGREDLSRLSGHAKQRALEAWKQRESETPFDLATGPLLRATLIELGPDEHTLLFTMHHIVSDAWSMGVLIRELGALYVVESTGTPSPLPELEAQYADYAMWQREWLSGDELARHVGYWKKKLAGAPALSSFPTDRPRPPLQSHRGAAVEVELSAALSAQVKALAKAEGATPFMVLLSAFQLLLARWSGRRDVVVGSPIANRTTKEVKDVIGFFVNTLALRGDLAGAPTVRELIRRTRETTLEAYEHQALPFEKIVEELNPERSLAHAALFQVMFTLQNTRGATLALPGLELAQEPVEVTSAKFDLSLSFAEEGGRFSGLAEYATDLFERSTIERLMRHLVNLLTAMLAKPDARAFELDLLSAEEAQQLHDFGEGARRLEHDRPVHHLFAEQAKRTPRATAVSFGAETLSYRELDERSNQLARHLQRRGVAPDVLVAICAERSLELVVAMLGVLKAGGAYVPLDPSYPRERLAHMLEDSGAEVLLTQARLRDAVPTGTTPLLLDEQWAEIAEEATSPPPSTARSDQLAYVLYTSGSTGRPKGVAIPHRALSNHMRWMNDAYPLTGADRVLQKTPIAFDASVWEFYAPLSSGAQLVMAPPLEHQDPTRMWATVERERVTVLQVVPAVLALLAEEPAFAPGSALRRLFCGGEALPQALAARVARRLGVEVVNLYGPTEVCIDATSMGVVPDGRSATVPIGRPITNLDAHVLDEALGLAPVGVSGELCLSGAGLARGYWCRPELTAASFVPNPYGAPGSRMYRTGDLARWLPDGTLEYLGRIDHQVKLRGFRIELGEIESALGEEVGVQSAVVLVREDAPGQKRLVAYVTGAVDVSALREALRARLPEYMVPSTIVILEALPLTPNGKVDRRALPAPERDEASYVAPRTSAEAELAEMWRALLGVERVGVTDDFFTLGGHSLLATRLVSQLRAQLGVEVPVRVMFEAPTVERLARRIEALRGEGALAEEKIERATREGKLPLSYAQERLWFLDQLEPGSSAYNLPGALRLQGKLDVAALREVLRRLVARHESLRTRFVADGGEARQVIEETAEVAWVEEDLRGREEEAQRRAIQEASRPFDLHTGPLLRVRLLALGDEEHVLLFTMHHIVSDGWSMGVLVREVGALYAAVTSGQEAKLEALPIQYADYAAWQRRWLSGERLAAQAAYWKQQLAGAPALLSLPTDRPRPATQRYRGASIPVALGAELSAQLAELSRARGMTPFMVLLAGYAAVLSRYSGQADVVVGTPIANRTRKEVEGLIGFFVNTLAMRVRVEEQTVEALLGEVKEATLGAYEHQNLPFERLVSELAPERSLNHAPVFQVMLVLQNAPTAELVLPGLSLSVVETEDTTAKFDLTLTLSEGSDGLGGTLSYATDLFDEATVKRMMAHFAALLRGLVARPSAKVAELSLLTEREARQQRFEWNDATKQYRQDQLLHELFEEQAVKTPAAVALEDDETRWSYAEVEARANQLARYLQKRGVGPEVLVGICVKRTAELVVAMLGVLKAGGAYVPLDPLYPPERLAYTLEDSRARLLLTQADVMSALPAHGAACIDLDRERAQIAAEATSRPTSGAEAENLAYVIYTSGSTGRPKGVAITQGNAAALVHWSKETYGSEEVAGVLFATSVCFDLSIWEVFVPLSQGGKVVVAENALELAEGKWREEVTLVNTVPSAMAELVRSGGLPKSVRTVNLAGEPLGAELVSALYASGHVERVYDLYGPTEDTTYSTYALRSATGRATIGKSLGGKQAYVVEESGLAAVGVPGELYLAGAGLARGYLNRAELTAASFVPNPYGAPGSRMYRTGDLARWLPDGTLEYLGRIDHQVKLRGFRIELGEIESALRQETDVRECVVLAREDVPGHKRLCAYVVGEVDVDGLKRALRTRLPEYMVPAAFVVLEALPRTPNGKVDRKALPAPEYEGEDDYVAPRTELEAKLAEIWQDVLRLERVGVRDNFFELGGDSILSIQIVSRARAMGMHLTPKQLFEQPRIEALAKQVGQGAPVDAEQGLVTGEVPLTPIEGWFFEHGEDEEPWHFNQAVLLGVRETLDVEALQRAVSALQAQHDALRLRYRRVGGGREKWLSEVVDAKVEAVDLRGAKDAKDALRAHADALQASLDLERGPLLRVATYELGSGERRLLIVIHHVAVDGVSWRVLLGDLEKGYRSAARGEAIALGPKTSSVKAWATRLLKWATVAEEELAYWRAVGGSARLPREGDGAGLVTDEQHVGVQLDEAETAALLREVPAVYRTQVNDALLLAVTEAFEGWTGSPTLTLDLEGHGRESLFDELDVSRTVGWFTSLYPVTLDLSSVEGAGERLKVVKEQLRAIPHKGLGYGVLKYLGRQEIRAQLGGARDVIFNYLGQLDQALEQGSVFEGAPEDSGSAASGKRRRGHALDLSASVSGGQLRLRITFATPSHRRETVEALGDHFLVSLRRLLAHCRRPEVGGYTPSDFPLATLPQAWLDRTVGRGEDVEDIYALSPMQEGMLFHALLDPESASYFEQTSLRLRGPLDADALEAGFRGAIERHEILRTSFHWRDLPRPAQVVHRQAAFAIERHTLDAGELEAFKRADRARGFALEEAPLMRVSLVQLGEETHELVWSFHHILLDGWCLPIVMKEVLAGYEAARTGQALSSTTGGKYRDYIAWVARQDEGAAERYFRGLLAGFDAATVLGRRERAEGRSVEEVNEQLSEEGTQRLKRAAQAMGVTVNTVVQGAWGVMLARYSGSSDVVFGTVGAGRPAEVAGVEGMVGLFINTLPVRMRVEDGETVRETLEKLQAQQVETRRYEATPLAKVQSWSEVESGPLFECIYGYENYPLGEALEEPGEGGARLRVERVQTVEQTHYPLSLTVLPGRALGLRLQYDRRRFDAEDISALLSSYQRLLERMIEEPEGATLRLRVLGDEEERRLLAWNDTEREYPEELVHEQLAAQARRTPEAVAVQHGAVTLSYRELDERSDRLAHFLRKLGVGLEARVGLCVQRSVEMVVGMLGILKAGGAYVPLDPTYPAERLTYMMEDCGAAVLVTQSSVLAGRAAPIDKVVCLDRDWPAIEQEATGAPRSGARADNLCYVIYTSGSTGKPKGTQLTHRGLSNLGASTKRDLPLGPESRVLQFASFSFDTSVGEIFPTLLAGARLHLLVGERTALAEQELLGQLLREEITVATLPPALLNVVTPSAGLKLRTLVTAGEQCPAAVVKKWSLTGLRFVNEYGPTETTVCATRQLMVADGAPPPIGKPIANFEAYVLDEQQQLAPLGASGELYLGGVALARGYLGRTELTAERFVPSPFGEGERLYRTGDLVRWQRDGTLEYQGRIDQQVKLRGFRIELGEVEAALNAESGVVEAAAAVKQDARGQRRLIGYVVGSDLDTDALRTSLAAKLPPQLIPHAIVLLDRLPLSPNGKLDRKALPDGEWRGDEAQHVAPRTAIEHAMAALWTQVLGAERVGVNDDFFELGGHSLLATRLVSQVRATLGIELPVRAVFDAPTLEAMSLRVLALTEGPTFAGPKLERVPRTGALELSFAQERLWFIDQLEPGSAAYNIPAALRLRGRLDEGALRRSLLALTQRHEALRTRIVTAEGRGRQVIEDRAELAFQLVDLRERTEDERARLVMEAARRETTIGFDLHAGAPWRTTLLRLRSDEHVLLLTMHHIVSDGWSMSVVVRELAALYRAEVEGADAALAALPIQYADYAAWQRRWLSGAELERQSAYWRDQLAGAPGLLAVPTDRPRPAQQSYRGATVPVSLGVELSAQINALAKAHGGTPFMVLLAAFQLLLSRYSGQRDVVVGTPIANRTRKEVEDLIGFFANTLAMRTRIEKDETIDALLEAVKETTLSAYAHQDLPFEKLVELVAAERSLSYAPVFQVMFILQNAPLGVLALPELELSSVAFEAKTAKFDLTLSVGEGPRGYEGALEYATDLFDEATVERMMAHLVVLLRGMVQGPSAKVAELSLLTEREARQQRFEWNDATKQYRRDQLLHELFEAQAVKTPEAVALEDDETRWSYAEVEARANQLARYLQKRGVGPEVLVGICVKRTAELVVAMLGVLKAGGAYVPLDPLYPPERLAYTLEDSRARLLLTQADVMSALPAHGAACIDLDRERAQIAAEATSRPTSGAEAENLAYVIYTSGSTGRPKGVAITQGNAAALVHWSKETYGSEEVAGVLFATSVCFDLSIWEVFVPLSQGGKVVVAENALELAEGKWREEVTLVNTVPSAMAELVRSGGLPKSVRTVNLAGEPLGAELVSALYASGHVERVYDLYGPTEDTTYSTYALRSATGRATIGKSLGGKQAYVVEESGLAAVGVPGELYLAGAGLARGYLNRAELTAASFVPNPYGAPGSRMYRTGDLARWLPDGTLEYLGRIDHQVKLRGFRIELGEIESALGEEVGVQSAVVLVREDAPGQKRLVAYVTGAVDVSALREALRARLPEYMVPSAIVILEALPLTPNGKVNRQALPAPERDEASYVAPRTSAEAELAEMWRALLGVERVGVTDDFFTLGGHSLLATRLVSQLRAQLGVEVPVRVMFEAPTVERLARRIEALRGEGALAEEKIERATREGKLPLSYAQERLWFLDQLEPGSSAYNLPGALRLQGKLDVAALREVLRRLVARHESLRTRFVADGGEARQVIEETAEVAWVEEDLRGRSDEAERRASQEASRPFDLHTGPLLRVRLLALGDEEHVLLFTMHHIVSDGWSMGVLVREVGALYAAVTSGQEAKLEALPIQYADYAAWQRRWLSGERLAAQAAYWKQQLVGAPALLSLPTDRPRPATQRYRGASIPVALGAELSEQLAELGRTRGMTPFMVLLAGYAAVLSRYSGQADVVVGTPIANRTRKEVEGLIGFFVNTLAMRVRVEEQTVEALLGEVKEATLGAYEHQDLPFERLVSELAPERSLNHAPVFQVMLVLQNAPTAELVLPGLSLSLVETEATTAKFDLTLTLSEGSDGLGGTLSYATDLFDEATVERMMAHLVVLLRGMVQRPDAKVAELDLLSAQEQRQLDEWSDTHEAYRNDQLLHELFSEQANREPSAAAVSCDGETLSYGELEARSNQLARYLRARGVAAEALVGICVERSLDLVVGLLGILKAGGAYVPLDPSYPRDRLAFMVADSKMKVLVTQEALLSALPAHDAEVVCVDRDREAIARQDRSAATSGARPESVAYVIYTSGSTGRPKGVQVTHQNVVRLFEATQAWYGFGAADVWTMFHSYAFDFSVWELWGALLHGGRVVVVPHWVARDAAAFHALLVRERVTVLNQTPSAFYQLIAADEASGSASELSLRAVIFGGEALDLRALLPWYARHRDDHPRLINMYGITETTVHVTYRELGEALAKRAAGSLIGRAIPDLQVHVLDAAGQRVPVGVAGEMYVGGDGLARGYLDRADLTAERFVPNPYAAARGARMYRTGDLARWLADGTLEYLGRIDHQVKIRGFRIELGEIESALAAQKGVRSAVVLAREDVPGHKRLCAYVVGEHLEVEALKHELSTKLPEYMVPAAFVVLEAMPLTANGKIDRKALPAPEYEGEDDYVAPRTELEAKLAEIWKDVLRLERVGVRDNFFELGGDSILSIQIVSRARAMGMHLTPKQLFEQPRIEALAKQVGQGAPVDAEQGLVTGEVPLTPIEGWFFEHGEDEEPWHFNQAVLLRVREALDVEALQRAVSALQAQHDALRLRYRRVGGGREKWLSEVVDAKVEAVDLRGAKDAKEALETHAAKLQASLDLERGPLLRVATYELGSGERRLLIVIHHVAVDGVSWRVLLGDLEKGYRSAARGEAIALGPKTSSVKAWATRLLKWGTVAEEELAYWRAAGGSARLPREGAGTNLVADEQRVMVQLEAAETAALLREVPAVYRTQVNEALLLAVTEAFEGWTGSAKLTLEMEGHGREPLFDELDVSRTVGWFTSLYPVTLDLSSVEGAGERLKVVKEQLRAIPHKGLGYGVLKYLGRQEVRAQLASQTPEVIFNYLGQLDQALEQGSVFEGAPERSGRAHSPKRRRAHVLDLSASVSGGRLMFGVSYAEGVHRRETMEALGERFLASLRRLIAHCRSPEAGGYTPSDFPLAKLSQAWLDRTVGRGENIEDIYALSPMQDGLLFHSLLDPESQAYFEQMIFRLVGPLDDQALERAWQTTIEQHDILRTSFEVTALDRPVQIVHRRVPFALERVSLLGLETAAQSARLLELRRADRARGFAHEVAPLVRVTLVALEPGVHQLIWSFHHLLLDGWSCARVMKDVLLAFEAYASGSKPSTTAVPRYRDYIAWLHEQDRTDADRHFARLLSGVEAPTSLGIARGPVGSISRRHGEVRASLTEPETRAARAMVAKVGVTLNTLVEAAWGLLLARYSGHPDVVFGATGSGRPPELPGVEQMIGVFINTLPVRVRVDEHASVRALLLDLQAQRVETRRYEASPLVQVRAASAVPHGQPLFESLLVFENYPMGELLQETERDARRPQMEIVEAVEQTHYALTLTIMPGRALQLKLQYDADRIDEDAARRLVDHFQRLLDGMVLAPEGDASNVPMLTAPEERQLLREWNPPQRPYPLDELVHAQLVAQAKRTPDAVAVRCGDRTLSYRELDEQSNQLAHALRGRGVGPEVLVGLCVERSVELVVGLLGILKAGGAYVPLDPAYPQERLEYMLRDSGATVLVAQQRVLAKTLTTPEGALCLDRDRSEIERQPKEAPRPRTRAQNVAYVIYTSGSTGRPKGVVITHANAAALVRWSNDEYPAEELRGVLFSTSVCFDLSIWELFVPLSNGGTVVVAENALAIASASFGGDVTLVNTVPSVMAELVRSGGLPKSVRTVNLAGEPLATELVRALYSTGHVQRVYDLYGPTEDTTYSTYALRRDAGRATIGTSVGNKRAYVLDDAGRLAAAGVPGELFLSGVGVSRGYLHRPDLTAARYVPNPYGEPGERMYRTGDLVRWSSDGTLEYVGRIDHQVKIRGYRIELGEIESALRSQPGVQDSVVLAREDVPGQKRLCAYVVGEVDAKTLEAALRTGLPDYMVPTAIVILTALPMTPNGKIDRKALPKPDARTTEATYVAPRDEVEKKLVEIWKEVLRVERPGVRDNFFELGGDSISGIQVMTRAQAAKIEFSAKHLFSAPTIEALARVATVHGMSALERATGVVAGLAVTSRQARHPLRRRPLEGKHPLSLFQRRMWLDTKRDPSTTIFNLPRLIELPVDADLALLERCVGEIVERHAVLRATFHEDETGPYQEIDAPVGISIVRIGTVDERVDLRGAKLQALWKKPFDLAKGPLLRAHTWVTPTARRYLLLTLHHIVCDNWSFARLRAEVMEAYVAASQGRPSSPAPLAVQYTDYAWWQRQYLPPERADEQGAYWRALLADCTPVELRAAPPTTASPEEGQLGLDMPAEMVAELQRFTQQHACTLFMVMATVYVTMLFEETGASDQVIGFPMINRPDLQLEPLIGYFVNHLCLRISMDPGMSAAALLERVRAQTLAAYEHQDVSLEAYLSAEQMKLLYKYRLNQMIAEGARTVGAAPREAGDEPRIVVVSPFELSFDLIVSAEHIRMGFRFRVERVDAATVRKMLERQLVILRAILDDPERSLPPPG